MADTIRHRGPDDGGVWVDRVNGLGLAHRRLAIVDLSASGHQPMLSATGRFVISFNGEIYNYQALRAELEASSMSGSGSALRWQGHSDTEVILAAFEQWGVEESLGRFNGMFAIALWDRRDQKLYLARDRFGEKPLYYGWSLGHFLFGSELKALRSHPGWQGEIDRESLRSYAQFGYVPSPRSIFKGIFKLPPAGLAVLRRAGSAQIELGKFWSAAEFVLEASKAPFLGTDRQAVEALRDSLRTSVAMRMHADVPLGAFLSGGIDSSLVVALMQEQSTRPIRTFSIGFGDAAYNEAGNAKAVAKYIGTDHTEKYIDANVAISSIPELPFMYDEPFADSSQIPTLLVSRLARDHVTVAMSGDAGDELFGGYNRHVWSERLLSKARFIPPSARRMLAKGLVSVPQEEWNTRFAAIAAILPPFLKVSLPGEKLHKLGNLLATSNTDDAYESLVSLWQPSELDALTLSSRVERPVVGRVHFDNPTQQMMYVDLINYLPDDILVKVDRATMSVGLEARVPFLDPDVVGLAWRLPMSMKIRGSQGKWILRQLAHTYVPKNLLERPKMGFSVPLAAWLRGPLREWASSLLDENRLRREGFWDTGLVSTRWKQHLAETGSWQHQLWIILMFQAWLEQGIA